MVAQNSHMAMPAPATVTSILGNIFTEKAMARSYRKKLDGGNAEHLYLSRFEMDRLRLRRKTDRGTDIALVLEQGNRLRHGDVVEIPGRHIVVIQLPEKVMSVRLNGNDSMEMAKAAALAGHAIGNRHRPISVEGQTISFPAMADSELTSFKKLFRGLGVELFTEEKVFLPTVETGGEHHHH